MKDTDLESLRHGDVVQLAPDCVEGSEKFGGRFAVVVKTQAPTNYNPRCYVAVRVWTGGDSWSEFSPQSADIEFVGRSYFPINWGG